MANKTKSVHSHILFGDAISDLPCKYHTKKRVRFNFYKLVAFWGVFLICTTKIAASNTDPQTIEVGVAWHGKSFMAERVLNGMKEVLSLQAPHIHLDCHEDLPDIESLDSVLSLFEKNKQAMVVMRSNGAKLLAERGVSIPTFIGAVNNPVDLGVLNDFAQPNNNISGVTYAFPAKMKLQAFLDIYPKMEKYVLLVEKGHPGSVLDTRDTEMAAARIGLKGRTVYCSSIEDAIEAANNVDNGEVLILGVQAMLMDNVEKILENIGDIVVFSYSEQAVENGALAGIVADDHKLGKKLGQMLIDHLIQGIDVADLPIQTDEEPRLKINYQTLEDIKHKIPYAFYSLAQSEKKLESILKSAPTGFLMIENNHIAYANDYALFLTGYTQEDVLGKNIQFLFYEDYEFDDFIHSCAFTQDGSCEVQWITQQGTVKHIEITTADFSEVGEKTSFILNAKDITDRITAEAKLRFRTQWFIVSLFAFLLLLILLVAALLWFIEKQKRAKLALKESELELKRKNQIFSALLDNLDSGVFMVDAPDMKPLIANPAALRILGRGILPNANKHNLSEVYKAFKSPTGIPYPIHEMPIVRGTHGEKSNIDNMEVERPDGSKIRLEVYGTPIKNDKGEVWASLVNFQDITQRKKQEKTIKKSRHDLALKNKELEQIVYVVSHDLRSPLINIDGFSNELERAMKVIKEKVKADKGYSLNTRESIHNEFTEMDKALNFIKNGVHQMDGLLKGLLKLSRAGTVVFHISNIDMNNVLKQLSSSYAYHIQTTKIRLIVEDLPPCKGDQTQLTQVFSNLIDNAIKYSDKSREGKIRIWGEKQGTVSKYYIEDNGMGIEHNEQKYIFDLFRRMHPNASEGEGIGLNIVKQILDRLEGQITLESKPFEGTKFTITLPTAENE